MNDLSWRHPLERPSGAEACVREGLAAVLHPEPWSTWPTSEATFGRGFSPANVTDFFGEGLLLPPVALDLAGEENPTVTRILAHNSRMPTNLMGDVRALVSGADVGAARLEELVHASGPTPWPRR